MSRYDSQPIIPPPVSFPELPSSIPFTLITIKKIDVDISFFDGNIEKNQTGAPMDSKKIIEKFGGQTALAGLIGKGQSTVAYWAKTGIIPIRWHSKLLQLAKEKGIELTKHDFIATIKPQVATSNSNKNSTLSVIRSPLVASDPRQMSLLGIQKQIEIDGIGMGVLSDGTAFLTLRGLARLCGVNHSVIQAINDEWDDLVPPPRVTRIQEILQSHGNHFDLPYIPIQQRSGIFYAYQDSVCLAILEYYSFDAGQNIREEAKKNYRLLAGKALREFIYTQVGYNPPASSVVPQAWRQFHDRVSLTYNSVPKGYFGVFKEIADVIVTLGQAGLHIDSNFVPDISVGISWGKHWTKNEFATVYGERIKFEHNYPDYFPQSISNPQEPWCYPEIALGEFRRWLRENYIGEGKFKNYIESKVREKALPVSFAQLAISAYTEN